MAKTLEALKREQGEIKAFEFLLSEYPSDWVKKPVEQKPVNLAMSLFTGKCSSGLLVGGYESEEDSAELKKRIEHRKNLLKKRQMKRSHRIRRFEPRLMKYRIYVRRWKELVKTNIEGIFLLKTPKY